MDTISNISNSQRIPHHRALSVRNFLRGRTRAGSETSSSTSPISSPRASTNTSVSTSRTPPQPQPQPLPRLLADLSPGDQPPPIILGNKVSALEVRQLNELIRRRYALDLEIWDSRQCHPRDRYILEEKMRRSDAALWKIRGIVNSWDRREVWKYTEDWQKFQDIKYRLERPGGKRLWAQNPPWGD